MMIKKTYVIIRGTAQSATFAFDALPPVLADRNDHVCGKLQTSWMAYNKNGSLRTRKSRMRKRCQDNLSCAEEQWTPSYLSFIDSKNVIEFNKIVTQQNRLTDITKQVRSKATAIDTTQLTVLVLDNLSPFLSTLTEIKNAATVLYAKTCLFILFFFFVCFSVFFYQFDYRLRKEFCWWSDIRFRHTLCYCFLLLLYSSLPPVFIIWG